MKKIMIISTCSYTIYNFRLGLMKEIKNKGNNVIGVGAPVSYYGQKLDEEGLIFIGLPINRTTLNPLSDIYWMVKLFRLLKKERPDIVHIFIPKMVIYGGIVATLAKVPQVIVTIVGLGRVFTTSRAWLRVIVMCLYKVVLKNCQTVFFQNNDDKALFLQNGLVPVEKTVVVPGSGVDTTKFSFSYSNKRQNKQALSFLMMARVIREKGVYEYVEAAKLIKERHPDVTFTLLGAHDIRDPSSVPGKDICDWKNGEIINYVGEVFDVREYITHADVVVLPSFYREGIPRSLLEAAAMGKPLITTDSVGCREVVVDGVNGYLVPPRDSRALAVAMGKFIDHVYICRPMGLAGRNKICAEFDEQVVIQKTLEAYNIHPVAR